MSAYGALAAGDAADVEAPDMGYLDWAVWQRAFLDEMIDGDETRMQRQLAYWRATLDDAPVLELPCDHERSATAHR